MIRLKKLKEFESPPNGSAEQYELYARIYEEVVTRRNTRISDSAYNLMYHPYEPLSRDCKGCCHCHIDPNYIFNYCMKHKRHMSKRFAPEFRTNCYLRFVDYPSDIIMDDRGIGGNNRIYSQEVIINAMSIALRVPKEYLYGTKEDK